MGKIHGMKTRTANIIGGFEIVTLETFCGAPLLSSHRTNGSDALINCPRCLKRKLNQETASVASLRAQLEAERAKAGELVRALERCADPTRWHAPCPFCGSKLIEAGCYIAREALARYRGEK